MNITTAARDRLHAFYAANPDVESANGDYLLDLPEALTDKLDELLLAATQEKMLNEHVAGCFPCREYGFSVNFLTDGTVQCNHDSENGWEGLRYDSVEA